MTSLSLILLLMVFAWGFWVIAGSPSPKPLFGAFVKGWKYPAGKFTCISHSLHYTGAMRSLKGETLEEMFERRDRILDDRIRANRPSMTIREYLAIPTDKSLNRYRMDVGDRYRMDVGVGKVTDGATGAVLERQSRTDESSAPGCDFRLTLYNLEKN